MAQGRSEGWNEEEEEGEEEEEEEKAPWASLLELSPAPPCERGGNRMEKEFGVENKNALLLY